MPDSTPLSIVLADLGRDGRDGGRQGVAAALRRVGRLSRGARARLMTAGFFGGFILGFLGTALPRMLSAAPLGVHNVLLVAALHLATVIAFATGQLALGEHLYI